MAHYTATDQSYSLVSHGLDEDGSIDEEEEESVFTRLIARGPTVVPPNHDSSPARRTEALRVLSGDHQTTATPHFTLPVSFVIIVAAALSSLELLFVWLSLVSPDWVRINFLLPIGATQNLAEILAELRSYHQNTMAVVLWITCLVLPCLYAVFAPSWILQLATQTQRPVVVTPHRLLLETLLPFSLTAVYGLAVIQAILHPAHELVAIAPAAAAGLFSTGVSCALITVALLRYHRYSSQSRYQPTSREMTAESVAPILTSTISGSEPLMRILEDEPVAVPTPSSPPTLRQRTRPTWFCLMVMFQLGLVALFLWVPVVIYPLTTSIVGHPLYYTQLIVVDTTTLVWTGLVPLCSIGSAAAAWMVQARVWKPIVYALPPHGSVVLALVLLVVAWNADDAASLGQGPWWLVGQSIVAELVWLGTLAWA